MNGVTGRLLSWLAGSAFLLPAACLWVWHSQTGGSSGFVVAKKITVPQQSTPIVKVIESELLPIAMTTDRVAGRIDIATGGGAIQPIGDAILIMDRLGRFFAYKGRQISATEIPDLPLHRNEFSAAHRFPASETTLRAHDLKFDSHRDTLYATYDSYDSKLRVPRFVVSRIILKKDSTQSVGGWETVFSSAGIPLTTYYAGRGAGGKMLVTESSLYFAVGDYSLDRILTSPRDIAAQNPESVFGKIYAYNLSNKALRVVSIGHRSPEGLALTSSGEILETEHGPRGGDELNVIVEGVNYGWPYASYGTHYFSYRPYFGAESVGGIGREPIYAWVPSIAVTALIESSSFFAGWKGNIIVGSLKAQSLFRLKVSHGRVVFAEPIWLGYRVRDIAEKNEQLIIWTDDGSIVFLSPDRRLLALDRLNVEDAYAKSALAECSTCHSFAKQNQFYWAPSLRNVYGRRIGGDQYQNYSEALHGKQGVWNEGNLAAFLLDPQRFLPGTSMINPDLTSEEVINIVAVLKGLKERE